VVFRHRSRRPARSPKISNRTFQRRSGWMGDCDELQKIFNGAIIVKAAITGSEVNGSISRPSRAVHFGAVNLCLLRPIYQSPINISQDPTEV
jgi:hypothetical protein